MAGEQSETYSKIIEALLTAGTNPNSMRLKGYTPPSRTTHDGTAIFRAGKEGGVEAGTGGMSSMELAKQAGQDDMIKLLRKFGAGE